MASRRRSTHGVDSGAELLVVAVAFGPVRDWLQRQVDRRILQRSADSVAEALVLAAELGRGLPAR